MTNIVADYLIQFIPVILGILFFVLVKTVSLTEDKVVIRSSGIAEQRRSNQAHEDPNLRSSSFDFPLNTSEIGNSKIGNEISFAWNVARQSSDFQLWRGYLGKCENMRDGVFERKAYDMLIMGGILQADSSNKAIRKSAWEKLGFIDINDLKKVALGSKFKKNEKLTVFTPDSRELLQCLLRFSSASGFLLPYLAGYTLDFEGV